MTWEDVALVAILAPMLVPGVLALLVVRQVRRQIARMGGR